jgi:FkbM family methyltransferase
MSKKFYNLDLGNNVLKIVPKLPFGRRTLRKIFTFLLPHSITTALFNLKGIKMYLDITQDLDFNYAQNIFDKHEVEFLIANYQKDTYFLDIGANIGFYSFYVAQQIPEAKIVAFEPDPYNADRLRKNIEINNFKNIKVCEYAISDKDGIEVLMMNVSKNRGGSSLLISQLPWQKEEVTQEVTCRTLLNAIRENNIDKISILKLDIEGYEYPVLKKYFEEAHESLYPKALVVEAFGSTIKLLGGSPIQLLINKGYRLVNHTNCNFFFIKN